MHKNVGWLWLIGLLCSVAAAYAQAPPAPTPVTKYDGTYAYFAAANVNETFRDFNNRELPCGHIRDMGPLVIKNGQAKYYLGNRNQPISEGTVGSHGELMMRLAATPAPSAGWGSPGIETSTIGSIDGNGIARARRMGGYCSYELVWQKTSSHPSGNKKFDGTYALVRVNQVNEDNGGSGTNGVIQCANIKPSSLVVTKGQARLLIFDGMVGSRGELRCERDHRGLRSRSTARSMPTARSAPARPVAGVLGI